MSTREVDEARDALYRAGIADRMRELSRREHYDAQEALDGEQMPLPASWDDVEIIALGWPRHASNMRAILDANRGKWIARVVDTWEARIANAEAKWSTHCESAEHARWLSTGGPARLWERLQAEKASAASEYFSALAQWRMDEMVRLFLNQAAE